MMGGVCLGITYGCLTVRKIQLENLDIEQPKIMGGHVYRPWTTQGCHVVLVCKRL